MGTAVIKLLGLGILALLLVSVPVYGGLCEEITLDPLTRGYSSMTDEQLSIDLNTVYRTRYRQTMTASEVANQINKAEFDALSIADEALIWNVLHLGVLDPFGIEATIFISAFGGGSTTISNLQTARLDNISRATELGVTAQVGEVEDARGPVCN